MYILARRDSKFLPYSYFQVFFLSSTLMPVDYLSCSGQKIHYLFFGMNVSFAYSKNVLCLSSFILSKLENLFCCHDCWRTTFAAICHLAVLIKSSPLQWVAPPTTSPIITHDKEVQWKLPLWLKKMSRSPSLVWVTM